MKNNLSYSPSQRRGIIFMFLIIGGYFIYLFYVQSYNSELSPIEVTDSSSISKEEIKEFKIQIPVIKNPNSWDNNDWTLLGFSNKQIRIINNYKFKIDSLKLKNKCLVAMPLAIIIRKCWIQLLSSLYRLRRKLI